MKSYSLLTVLALVGCATTGATPNASIANAKHEIRPTTSTRAQQLAPEGFVLVEEQESIDLRRLPLALLDDARTDFSNRNYGEAAADLRLANRIFHAGAGDQSKMMSSDALKRAEKETESLANDVRAGKISSKTDFDSRLAGIMFDKSSNDASKASSNWAQKAYKSVGYDLTLASDELEQGVKWSEQAFDSAAHDTDQGARTVGQKLLQGTHWTSEEVNKAIHDFHATAGRLADKMHSSEGSSSATTQPARSDTSK